MMFLPIATFHSKSFHSINASSGAVVKSTRQGIARYLPPDITPLVTVAKIAPFCEAVGTVKLLIGDDYSPRRHFRRPIPSHFRIRTSSGLQSDEVETSLNHGSDRIVDPRPKVSDQLPHQRTNLRWRQFTASTMHGLLERHAFINGRTQESRHTKSFESIDPSTLKPIATIHTSSESTLDAAVNAAAKAFPSWASTPAIERSRVLLKAANIIRERTHELAVIETKSTGKPYSETSTVDITTGADVLEYYANLVGSGGLNGESFPLRSSAWVYTTKAPLGVCVGIGAWNYPIQIALWKSGPCLAAGNCMVYKPSEFTSMHAEELAKIYKEAGLPDGVFNVVYGAGEVGGYLTKHPGVAKVSFTGQVSTGRKVAGSASGEMKYVTMELGGKSPLIVLPDADVESAVDGAMMANFFSTGQVCTNGTRVFVPRAMKSQFERKLVEKMRYVRAGDLYAETTNFGPLVSQVHHGKVMSYIKHGIEHDKAKLLYGGLDTKAMTSKLPKEIQNGLWVQPTVFTDCSDNMKIVREEIFGPVMSILYYDTVDEAVTRANDTQMGLAAGVFGKDINTCHDIMRRIEAGITWINTWGESPAEMAVGGWKQSGVGVENGHKGIESWVKNKSTLVEMGGSVPTVFAKL